MRTLDLDSEQARISAYYESLADEALLHEFGLGPGAYRDRATWEAIANEVQKRGLATSQGVTEIETTGSAVAAAFCVKCRATTSDEDAGNPGLITVNLIFWFGSKLTGHSDECPTCGSYVARLWNVFLIPLPGSYFRVIDLEEKRFISRRMVDY